MMIVAVVFGYVLLTRNADTPQKQVPIEYSVVVDNVPEEIKNSAKVGDAVRDGVTNSQIGKITYVEVYPYTLATDDLENGTKKQTEMPGRYTVLITIEANASKSGGSFSVDGKEIAAGLYLPIQSANFSGEGYCVTVKEK